MIRKLQRKLRSRTGASMILALLFLMFCSFVGGSVLVSATANAYRVTKMAEQQDFLDQRSAALLLSDELQLDEGQQLRLHVLDAYRTTKEMAPAIAGANSGAYVETGRSATERVITFQLMSNVEADNDGDGEPDDTFTEMQRLMLETTIWRYLVEQAQKQEDKTQTEPYIVVLKNFLKDENGVELDLSDFWFQSADVLSCDVDEENNQCVLVIDPAGAAKIGGTLTVTSQLYGDVQGIDSLRDYTCYFTCGRGNDMYDLRVDFGELSQLQMTMDAYSGTSEAIRVSAPITRGNVPGLTGCTGFIQVDTTSTQTLISWDDPMIQKGGAEA